MADDERNTSGKWIIIGLTVCALAVILMAAIAFLAWSYGSPSSQTNTLKLKPAGNGTISDSQLSLAKSIVQDRFHQRGLDASVSSSRDAQGNAFLLIKYANITYGDAVSIATAPGVFEIRIQAQGNQSEHILYGEDVRNVSSPQAYRYDEEAWGVPITLTQNGAQEFQQACIKYGATTDPPDHALIMLLDGKEIDKEPLSSDLAAEIALSPVTQVVAMTGTGNNGKAAAYRLSSSLQSGPLPVGLEVADAGNG